MAYLVRTSLDDKTVAIDRNQWSGRLSLVVDGEAVETTYAPAVWNAAMYAILFVLGYALGAGWI